MEDTTKELHVTSRGIFLLIQAFGPKLKKSVVYEQTWKNSGKKAIKTVFMPQSIMEEGQLPFSMPLQTRKQTIRGAIRARLRLLQKDSHTKKEQTTGMFYCENTICLLSS